MLFLRVVAQRIERATKRFVVTQRATLVAKMVAFDLYANAAEAFLFVLGKGDFQRGVTCINVAATLAFGAVVKQHASTPKGT